jgi:hypothetical protein
MIYGQCLLPQTTCLIMSFTIKQRLLLCNSTEYRMTTERFLYRVEHTKCGTGGSKYIDIVRN